MAEQHLPENIRNLYEVYDYRHAIGILHTEFPDLFQEICTVLENFRLTNEMIITPGGNESEIPKVFSRHLRPLNWVEGVLNARVIIDDNVEVRSETHKIDYVKDRIAFDLEWNSKDQTFDRDLYAFRAFFDYHKISVGILVTRATALQEYFSTLGTYTDRYGTQRLIQSKYGASTTHMDKLVPRLEAGRSGGCPVLALGITTALIED
ncbi:MAG: hypothetical protein JEZ06_18645 [Anaerolineaceae bacterium]|nr:hypothetical protein [Anaerolineaceae bacterium]